MTLVPAWDKRTGEPVAPTPESWIGHPVLGPHLTATKPEPVPEPEPTASTEAPKPAKRRTPRSTKEA